MFVIDLINNSSGHVEMLAYNPAPRYGHITVANSVLMKLVQVIIAENRTSQSVLCMHEVK